jgi:hypothetical protein
MKISGHRRIGTVYLKKTVIFELIMIIHFFKIILGEGRNFFSMPIARFFVATALDRRSLPGRGVI